MRPLSVLLLDGESPYALAVARCLTLVPGLRLHVLSAAQRSPLRYSRRIASFALWSGCERPEAARECARIARELGSDVCLATNEPALELLIREGHTLPVPGIGVPTAECFEVGRDKWQLRRFLHARALPHPATELCAEGEAALARLEALRFPVLVKPRVGGNGAGIHKIDDLAGLTDYVRGAHLWEQVVAQTFVDGRDIDCSVLCQHGEILAHTIQRGFTPTKPFKPPGGVEFIDDDRVLSIVRELMAALNWNGVAHVDLRYESGTGNLNIIEVNPRFWGSVLGSLHAGVNFPYLACLAALGEPFAAPVFRPCRYVAGATALSYWRRGRISAKTAGFSFVDTMFWYVRSDPCPAVFEALWRGSSHIGRYSSHPCR